jgi:hypothetical protein
MPWMTPKATSAGEAVEPVMIQVHGSKPHLGVGGQLYPAWDEHRESAHGEKSEIENWSCGVL